MSYAIRRRVAKYVRRRAMGDMVEYPLVLVPPTIPPPKKTTFGTPPPRRVFARARLGDTVLTDATDQSHDPMTQADFQQRLLASVDNVAAWQERWVKKDELQRWIQIGATVSIPLFTGLWRWLGFKRAGIIEK